jgi:hypothetical protein
MSHQLISRNADLKRLRDEGYELEVRSNHLLMKHIPYVNSEKKIAFGVLVSELSLANDATIKPETHVVHFTGDHPCNKDGSVISKIVNESSQKQLAPDVVINHSFSSKPLGGTYSDYYHKMTTYAEILCGQAQAIDPTVTAKTFAVIESEEGESVFNYIDTATSRAEIGLVSSRLEIGKVAIVGLGGTGSYILDLIAKTPVKEIHLFDGDKFSQHNAFRSPGAASGEELKQELKKVDYYKSQYSRLRQGIIVHAAYVDISNVDQLREMKFVFLCLDRGEPKKMIAEKLEEFGLPFIDVGMGVVHVDGSLQGILRVTTSTNNNRALVKEKDRIPFSNGDENNEYSRNIQVADLNALNAALAVIKWKKLFGFYLDLDHEHYTTYTIDGNMLLNEDQL